MSNEIQKTALRLPRDLHEAIHKAAKESGRTMNAEIVYRLQQSFDKTKPSDNGEWKATGLQFKNLQISERSEQYYSHGPIISLVEKAISILKEADNSLRASNEGEKESEEKDKDKD